MFCEKITVIYVIVRPDTVGSFVATKKTGMKQQHKINRRDFLSKSTMAGMGITLGTSMMFASSQKNVTGNSTTISKNNTLSKRKLGSLEVTELGFGCMNIAWAYGNPPTKEDAIKLIRNAYEQGVRFFDTAEIYGPHISERTTGEALKSFRKEVVIASKIGFDIDFETAQMKGGLNSKPEHIKQAVDFMQSVCKPITLIYYINTVLTHKYPLKMLQVQWLI